MKQLRSNMRTKNAAKVTWLLSKYRKEEEDTKDIFTVPGDIEDYKDAKIFDSGFETPEVVTDYKPPEIVQLGDISPPLDEDELSVLQLPTKTSVNGKLKLEDFKVELGMMSTKLRWEISKELEEKVDEEEAEISEEDQEKMDEVEARARIPFDPNLKELNLNKRKVTDSKDNSMVHMPKPLPVDQESKISVRETTFEGIFKEYLRQFCDKNGKQLPNLPRNSMRGLAKLKKRVDDGTCVIMETDKTGRFAIVSIEAFLEMGAVHTENDLEIDQKDVDDRERHLNGHVSMLLKITEMGKDWRHQDRFRESNIKH